MANYFGTNTHWRLETVDRGAFVNVKISGWRSPADPNDSTTQSVEVDLRTRVSSQNIQDNLLYGVTPSSGGVIATPLGRDKSFMLPLTIKVFPKAMVCINTNENDQLMYHQDHTQGSIHCTDYDYGFPIPDSDPPAWESGRRYIGSIFVDESQNNPL